MKANFVKAQDQAVFPLLIWVFILLLLLFVNSERVGKKAFSSLIPISLFNMEITPIIGCPDILWWREMKNEGRKRTVASAGKPFCLPGNWLAGVLVRARLLSPLNGWLTSSQDRQRPSEAHFYPSGERWGEVGWWSPVEYQEVRMALCEDGLKCFEQVSCMLHSWNRFMVGLAEFNSKHNICDFP